MIIYWVAAILTGLVTVLMFTDRDFLDDFFGRGQGVGMWVIGVLAIFSVAFFGTIMAPLVWVALIGKGLYELGNRHAKAK